MLSRFQPTVTKVRVTAGCPVHRPAHQNETELFEGAQTGVLAGYFLCVKRESLAQGVRLSDFPWSPCGTLRAPLWGDETNATPSPPASLKSLAFLSLKERCGQWPPSPSAEKPNINKAFVYNYFKGLQGSVCKQAAVARRDGEVRED